jgi:lysophospholipase L1-like esterase
MLYCVGDSNSVFTSRYFSRPVDTSLCKKGWTTDEVIAAVRKRDLLPDATAFFVFVGLNDQYTGVHIADNVMQIVSMLRTRRKSAAVPIFLAPPFCVRSVTPKGVCDDRRKAAEIVWRELSNDGLGSVLVTTHVTRELFAKKEVQTQKQGSENVDPLHLNNTGYMQIAGVVNHLMNWTPSSRKRVSKPKVRYGSR